MSEVTSMSGLLRPQDLKQIASEAEVAKMDEERRLKKKDEQQKDELRAAFMEREVQPEAIERINKAIRIAAEQGHHQLQVLTFPCSYCSDGGRRINVGDPDWPETLNGFAKRAYDFYLQELRPLGYKISTEIVTWPKGMPGDVAMYLKW
jgi:hypothetical protein